MWRRNAFDTSHDDLPTKRIPSLRNLLAGVGLLALLLVAAVAVSDRGDRAAPPVQVRVASLSGFTPPTLSVQRGTTVTWVNDDELPHTITSSEGVFASQAIYGDKSFFFRFDMPGTYTYFSGFQPQMMGRIVVR
jgi:plastocyanin